MAQAFLTSIDVYIYGAPSWTAEQVLAADKALNELGLEMKLAAHTAALIKDVPALKGATIEV